MDGALSKKDSPSSQHQVCVVYLSGIMDGPPYSNTWIVFKKLLYYNILSGSSRDGGWWG